MTYKLGDVFKFRFENQHMWFEVVGEEGGNYQAKLLNTPVVDEYTNAVHKWGDVVLLPKAEVDEYRSNRRGITGVVEGKSK